MKVEEIIREHCNAYADACISENDYDSETQIHDFTLGWGEDTGIATKDIPDLKDAEDFDEYSEYDLEELHAEFFHEAVKELMDYFGFEEEWDQDMVWCGGCGGFYYVKSESEDDFNDYYYAASWSAGYTGNGYGFGCLKFDNEADRDKYVEENNFKNGDVNYRVDAISSEEAWEYCKTFNTSAYEIE